MVTTAHNHQIYIRVRLETVWLATIGSEMTNRVATAATFVEGAVVR